MSEKMSGSHIVWRLIVPQTTTSRLWLLVSTSAAALLDGHNCTQGGANEQENRVDAVHRLCRANDRFRRGPVAGGEDLHEARDDVRLFRDHSSGLTGFQRSEGLAGGR